MKKHILLLLALVLAVAGCPTGPVDVGVPDAALTSAPDASSHRLGAFNPTPTGTGLPHVVSGVQSAAASLIVDADVSASAAIAGSKISPIFGAQTVSTTTGLSVGTSATFGTNAAGTGTLRIPNASSLSARNAANSADIALVTLDASNIEQLGPDVGVLTSLRLGTAPVAGTGIIRTPYNAGTLWSNRASDASEAPIVRGGTDVYYFGSVAATNLSGSTVSLCPGGSDVPSLTTTSTAIGIFQPITGGGTSPYAMNGQDALAYAGSGNLTLLAADYSNASIQFTGARTAVGTVTIPAATNAQAYFKWFQNSTTGGFTLTLTTGAGTTQALGAGGTPHLFRVDGSGIVLLL